ncbi:hypothetical protein [Kocuria soli]|uniref:hypothetical protein n=1 Tax=Kocuria soli TaxID=2485125 RepID=UPI000F511A29|nr:hypothetical protein [Kocuria soli]
MDSTPAPETQGQPASSAVPNSAVEQTDRPSTETAKAADGTNTPSDRGTPGAAASKTPEDPKDPSSTTEIDENDLDENGRQPGEGESDTLDSDRPDIYSSAAI